MSNNAHFELPAHEVFGPQGEHVAALIERARRLTASEIQTLAAVRAAARDAARFAARAAARDDATRDDALTAAWNAMKAAARAAAWDDALAAALDTACALVVRDIIPTNCYDTLSRTWRTVIGPIHPEDEFWAAVTKATK